MRTKSQRTRSHQENIPRGQNPIRKKITQGNIPLFWFLWNIFLDRNFQMLKIYEFSLLHIHSLHIIFPSFSLSDEELALACVLYTYETPRTIVPNLNNWIG